MIIAEKSAIRSTATSTTTSATSWRTCALAVADLAILIRCVPNWTRLAHGLAAPHDWVARAGADQAISALCAAALWVTALWLGMGLAASLAASGPGRLGELGARTADHLLPRALGRVLAGTAGLSILAATGTAAATVPTAVAPTVSASVGPTSTPGWPTAGPVLPDVSVGWPTDTPVSSPTSTVDRTPVRARTVVVASGDSLWQLAARQLATRGPTAHRLGGEPAPASAPAPAPAQIAATWRQWFAANRAVIGPDPGLLHPGEILTVPAGSPSAGPAPIAAAPIATDAGRRSR